MALPQLLGPTPLSGTVPTQLIGGRLTLDNTTKLPVPTADLSAKTAIWYVPYAGRAISLWNSTVSAWQIVSIPDAGVSVNLGTLSNATTYDVFGYLNAGSLALEIGPAWTTSGGASAARATNIGITDGVYTKSGDKTRLYLGTFYTTATTTTEDSKTRRYLYNAYNRVERKLLCFDTTASWTYTTATTRAANNSTTEGTARVVYVDGLGVDLVTALNTNVVSNASSVYILPGVGVDSTTVNSCDIVGENVATFSLAHDSTYTGYPGIGQHYLSRVEYSQAVGTTTWQGSPVAGYQTGMTAWVKA